jgi:hypothetical protein
MTRSPNFWLLALTLVFVLVGIPLLVFNFFFWQPEYWEMFRVWWVSLFR